MLGEWVDSSVGVGGGRFVGGVSRVFALGLPSPRSCSHCHYVRFGQTAHKYNGLNETMRRLPKKSPRAVFCGPWTGFLVELWEFGMLLVLKKCAPSPCVMRCA